ncbi:shikimate kinase [Sporolactobacillus sp. THM7-7]|nr:shikimate kinase [Sporolactobacillus sp. THM7-7]
MIYLTGFMGAGKTTVGAALGKTCNVPVFDTDQLIEKEQCQSVQEMFREKGEPFFRNCETQVLRKLAASKSRAIITTGGGIITNPENRRIMRSSGTVFFLYCDIRTIKKRLASDRTRPLLQRFPGDELNRLYKKRLADYLEANYTIHTTGKPVDGIVHEILSVMYQASHNWVS